MTTTFAHTARIRCGNQAAHRDTTGYHYTVEQVRDCFRNASHNAYLDRAASEPEYREPDLSAFDRPAPAPCAKTSQEALLPLDSDGMYRNPETGQIFKVYVTVHGAHQRVAKELVTLSESAWYTKTVRGKQVTIKAEFVYRGKAGLRGLTGNMKMTLEEGKKYGAIYGVCVRCAATLTKEESIERAMGPVCAGKGNWA